MGANNEARAGSYQAQLRLNFPLAKRIKTRKQSGIAHPRAMPPKREKSRYRLFRTFSHIPSSSGHWVTSTPGYQRALPWPCQGWQRSSSIFHPRQSRRRPFVFAFSRIHAYVHAIICISADAFKR